MRRVRNKSMHVKSSSKKWQTGQDRSGFGAVVVVVLLEPNVYNLPFHQALGLYESPLRKSANYITTADRYGIIVALNFAHSVWSYIPAVKQPPKTIDLILNKIDRNGLIKLFDEIATQLKAYENNYHGDNCLTCYLLAQSNGVTVTVLSKEPFEIIPEYFQQNNAIAQPSINRLVEDFEILDVNDKENEKKDGEKENRLVVRNAKKPLQIGNFDIIDDYADSHQKFVEKKDDKREDKKEPPLLFKQSIGHPKKSKALSSKTTQRIFSLDDYDQAYQEHQNQERNKLRQFKEVNPLGKNF